MNLSVIPSGKAIDKEKVGIWSEWAHPDDFSCPPKEETVDVEASAF
jgi:hypothetical protein